MKLKNLWKTAYPLEEPIKSFVESQIDQCFEKNAKSLCGIKRWEQENAVLFRQMGKKLILLNMFSEQDLRHGVTEQLKLLPKPLLKINLYIYQFLRHYSPFISTLTLQIWWREIQIKDQIVFMTYKMENSLRIMHSSQNKDMQFRSSFFWWIWMLKPPWIKTRNV